MAIKLWEGFAKLQHVRTRVDGIPDVTFEAFCQ
jgi:hypothetical protein